MSAVALTKDQNEKISEFVTNILKTDAKAINKADFKFDPYVDGILRQFVDFKNKDKDTEDDIVDNDEIKDGGFKKPKQIVEEFSELFTNDENGLASKKRLISLLNSKEIVSDINYATRINSIIESYAKNLNLNTMRILEPIKYNKIRSSVIKTFTDRSPLIFEMYAANLKLMVYATDGRVFIADQTEAVKSSYDVSKLNTFYDGFYTLNKKSSGSTMTKKQIQDSSMLKNKGTISIDWVFSNNSDVKRVAAGFTQKLFIYSMNVLKKTLPDIPYG